MVSVKINLDLPTLLTPGQHRVALRFPSGDTLVLDVEISPEGRVSVATRREG